MAASSLDREALSEQGRRAAAPFVPILAALALYIAFPQALAERSSLPLGQPNVHRVLVIPVNLRGRAPVVLDRKQVAQALYGDADSVTSRYRAASYGKVEFAGSESDIVDPVTLSEPPDFCNTGLGRLAVLPKDAPCWWTGVGDIGGRRVWVKATTAKALQHELGHNLGMNHAVRWRGTDADDSDFMGSGASSLNAPHVVEMGWLRDYPGKVVELTEAGDVTLEALETAPRHAALPKVAIVHPAPGANTYYLSYRASSAADPLPDAFIRGLNIHIADAARHTGGPTYFVTSLSDGAAYHDGPMIVQQLSHSAGDRVTFHISFMGTGEAVPLGPPPAPLGTVQSLASGKCLDLPGGQVSDGTLPIQYDCHGGRNQQWTIEVAGDAGYRIVSQMSGKCIGTDSASAAIGGRILQSPCGKTPGQLWAIERASDGYVLRNVASRLCMDVPGATLANGAKPIVWGCNGGTNQTWRFQSPAIP